MTSLMEKRRDFSRNSEGYVNFMLHYPKSGEIKYFYIELCYGLLFKYGMTHPELPQIFYGFGTPTGTPEVQKYVEYLFTDSPFKEAYITKDFAEGMTYGFQVDASVPLEVLKISSIALRRSFETPNNAKWFCTLVDGGMDKQLAWAVVQQFYAHEKNNTIAIYAISTHEHQPFPALHGFDVYAGKYKPVNNTSLLDGQHVKTWEEWTKGSISIDPEKIIECFNPTNIVGYTAWPRYRECTKEGLEKLAVLLKG